MAQTQNDPFAQFRVDKPKEDPFASFRVDKTEKKEEPKGDLSRLAAGLPVQGEKEKSLWERATTSLLPEDLDSLLGKFGMSEPEPENYAGGVVKGLADYTYEDLIKPIGSPLGAGLTLAGGPIIRGGVKALSKLPGASKVASILGTKIAETEAPEFVKKIVSSFTPKSAASSVDEVAPRVAPRTKEDLSVEGKFLPEMVDDVPPLTKPPVLEEKLPEVLTEETPIDKIKNTIFGAAPEQPPVSNTQPITETGVIKPKVRANLDGTISPIDNPTKKFTPDGQPVPGPIDKLLSALDEARPLTEEQKKIYRFERGERVAKMGEVETPGQKGFFEKKGKLAGEHSKVSMEPLNLEQGDIDSLFNEINVAGLQPFQKISAGDGLQKILSGQVPQESEIRLLGKIFGEDKLNALREKLPKVDVKRTWLQEGLNLPRALQASYDLSFPFRQGKGLVYSKDWWNAWGSMVKSLGSEKSYQGVMEDILKRPNYKGVTTKEGIKESPFFQKAGLHLTDLTDLTSREEEFMSTIAERIPLGIGKGVRASSRAYTAFANKLRADHFDRLISNAEAAGLNPRENLELAQKIASFVNNATGRGELGSVEKHASALNSVFFSPRFIASRLQMMNPKNYLANINTPEGRFVNKQYLKSLLALGGAWLTEANLHRLNGAEVETDTTSSDFGKAKYGETRLDIPAGFQQYVVLASRLASGEYATQNGNVREYGRGFGTKTKFDALTDFLANKLAPIPSYGARFLRANENVPFNVVDESMRLFTPMILQDLSDILQEDPNLLPLMVPAAVGYGVDVQGERGDNRLFGNGLPEVTIPGEETASRFRR